MHQLVHIHHHLFYEGIGLRQLMDYYFLLQKTSDGSTFSINRSKKVIHQLGLDRFSCALMYVLQVVFGLERNKMLWSPSKKDGIFLLNEIMCSGNFGQVDVRKKSIRINGNLSGSFILRRSAIGVLIIGLGSGVRYAEFVDLFGES